MSGFTPGPWRWEVNHKSKQVQLCGGACPKYDLTVMDFARWGMGGAAPRFSDERGIMHRSDGLTVTVAGREHHAAWFQDIRHSDARLIATAPELLEALQEMYDSACTNASSTPSKAAFLKARVTLAKVAGHD